MKILVSGNHGYIGIVLTSVLLEKGYEVVGYDIDYYKDSTLEQVEDTFLHVNKDIRTIENDDVDGFEALSTWQPYQMIH